MNNLPILCAIVLVLEGCATAPSQQASSQDILSQMIERGNFSAYAEVEARFITAAKTGDREGILAALSPLTKRDSKKSETEAFIANTFRYFSDYQSTQQCKSVVATKDEYRNPGYIHYGAFTTVSGGGKPYVMGLTRENDEIYVSIVFGKLDKFYHARCRF